jgi:hypothetical protein
MLFPKAIMPRGKKDPVIIAEIQPETLINKKAAE